VSDTNYSASPTPVVTIGSTQAFNDQVYKGRTVTYATTTGSTNAQVLTLPTGSLYVAGTETDGDTFLFKAGFTNSGAATLQVLAPTGANVARAIQAGGTALVGGELIAGSFYWVVRLATTWQLVYASVAPSAVVTVVSPFLPFQQFGAL
jgi:hypothetical protein